MVSVLLLNRFPPGMIVKMVDLKSLAYSIAYR